MSDFFLPNKKGSKKRTIISRFQVPGFCVKKVFLLFCVSKNSSLGPKLQIFSHFWQTGFWFSSKRKLKIRIFFLCGWTGTEIAVISENSAFTWMKKLGIPYYLVIMSMLIWRGSLVKSREKVEKFFCWRRNYPGNITSSFFFEETASKFFGIFWKNGFGKNSFTKIYSFWPSRQSIKYDYLENLLCLYWVHIR